MRTYAYPWPASALGPPEMALLFQARAKNPKRTTITALLADAVRRAYGAVQSDSAPAPVSLTVGLPLAAATPSPRTR